jgi:hypothetical protein
MRAAGEEATSLVEEVHSWVKFEELLKVCRSCLVCAHPFVCVCMCVVHSCTFLCAHVCSGSLCRIAYPLTVVCSVMWSESWPPKHPV